MIIFFSFFVLSFYVTLRSEFRVVTSVTISALERCSVRLYLQLFVGESCLTYVICVCIRIVVSNTNCVVYLGFFLGLLHHMLPVSMDFSFF